MDRTFLDLIARGLAGSAPRRATLRAAAAGLAGLSASIGLGDAEAKRNGKRRCRKRLKKCGGRKKCCNGSGLIRCQIVQEAAKPECDGYLGRRCCGLDGASCDPSNEHCDCCGNTFCQQVDGEFRCLEPLT